MIWAFGRRNKEVIWHPCTQKKVVRERLTRFLNQTGHPNAINPEAMFGKAALELSCRLIEHCKNSCREQHCTFSCRAAAAGNNQRSLRVSCKSAGEPRCLRVIVIPSAASEARRAGCRPWPGGSGSGQTPPPALTPPPVSEGRPARCRAGAADCGPDSHAESVVYATAHTAPTVVYIRRGSHAETVVYIFGGSQSAALTPPPQSQSPGCGLIPSPQPHFSPNLLSSRSDTSPPPWVSPRRPSDGQPNALIKSFNLKSQPASFRFGLVSGL